MIKNLVGLSVLSFSLLVLASCSQANLPTQSKLSGTLYEGTTPEITVHKGYSTGKFNEDTYGDLSWFPVRDYVRSPNHRNSLYLEVTDPDSGHPENIKFYFWDTRYKPKDFTREFFDSGLLTVSYVGTTGPNTALYKIDTYNELVKTNAIDFDTDMDWQWYRLTIVAQDSAGRMGTFVLWVSGADPKCWYSGCPLP